MKWCHSSDLLERASMLLKMKNPFILQLIGWSQVADSSGSSYYLVMEDVQTELEGFIRERAEARSTRDEQEMLFPFSMALDMMMQIARGMWYLHRNGIAYMTLRSREVLLTVSNDDRARNSIGRLKLCHSALPLVAHSSTSLDFSADVLSFGLLCKEILTGNPQSIDAEGQLQLPTSTPLMLSDCLKACWNPKPQSRPEFGVICRLLRHLKLIVSNPLRLERLLYFNEAARAASKAPSADTISPVSKVRRRPDVDVMSISLQLIDINVRLLHAITPPDIYPLVAAEYYEAEPPTYFNTLVDISRKLIDVLSSDSDETSSSSSITQQRFVTANTGTLMTSLVLDGPMGLLKSGWIRTALGLGTLEMWLQSLSADWKNIHKVALGVALCLKHVCMTPPKIGYYSQEHGSVDGFYPIHPKNFLLNSQFKVALLLDNSPNAWKGLIQWAGAHPHAGEGADGILISIEAFTTFYYGHLLSFIINAHQSKSNSSLQHHRHCEFVLTNLANRCIQLKYLSMTEVVTILLSDNKLHQNI
ncbi:hypothetical protein KP509_06G026100 [Ceratopteris richardii]|nr:hypothetical protein KP509_06G026100 [Ceratopteris richardii]